MPIYEYRCNACDEDFERLVFKKDIVKCPKCDSDDIRKKFSTFGMSAVEKNSGSGSSKCSSCKSTSCSTC